MAIFPSSAIPSGAEAFTLDQSLRFEDGSSAKLKRTPGSTTNQKTFTFSVWVKRGNLTGADQNLLCASWTDQGNSSRYSYFTFKDNDRLQIFGGIYSTSSTTYSFWKETKAVYRDTSAWMHIVWRHDSTDGTPANRDRVYVNGILQEWDTSIANDTTTGLNDDSFLNITTSPMTLGCYNRSGRSPGTDEKFLDGYMAEMHFIDGTSVAATSFGESGDYGEWKPIEVTGLTYGDNGFYLSFAGGGIMSATGGDSIGTDGDYKYNTFLSDGTFTPSAAGFVEYLVIAGGGGGSGAGGGAGGYKTGYLEVTAQAYSITVGDGGSGAAAANNGGAGDNSVFSSITSTGGGGSGAGEPAVGNAGGSGGGGGGGNLGSVGGGPNNVGGAASPAGQGNAGGTGYTDASSYGIGGGGGGAGAVGTNASAGGPAGNGGNGLASSITGASVTRAGGGGGGGSSGGSAAAGSGGSGGGGAGNVHPSAPTAGTANTGGGGGGTDGTGAAGGSGIVILRYKFQ